MRVQRGEVCLANLDPTKGSEQAGTRPVIIRNLLDEDSYDWGSQGQPKGKPVEYIPTVGLKVVGGKNAPA